MVYGNFGPVLWTRNAADTTNDREGIPALTDQFARTGHAGRLALIAETIAGQGDGDTPRRSPLKWGWRAQRQAAVDWRPEPTKGKGDADHSQPRAAPGGRTKHNCGTAWQARMKWARNVAGQPGVRVNREERAPGGVLGRAAGEVNAADPRRPACGHGILLGLKPLAPAVPMVSRSPMSRPQPTPRDLAVPTRSNQHAAVQVARP